MLARVWALLLALIASLALAPAVASAASGVPQLALHDGTPQQVLYGADVPVSLTASLPAGSPKGYNLAYRVVLPPGVSYVAQSAGVVVGEPRQIPGLLGGTTLIWPNVDDLVANASHTLTFDVRYLTTADGGPAARDAGEALRIESDALISADARDEADFDASGEPDGPRPGSFSSRANSERDIDLSAIRITKSEPSPEGEIVRGLHKHQTVYTLKVENNHVNPTTGITVEDYVPAGLEFLGCAGQVDNTTETTTNPGAREEYPGSGAITVAKPTVDDGCIQPDHVETVELEAGNPGGLPAGVYTHVRWELGADLAAGGETRLTYAAAVPLRENTLDWTGATPDVDGGQIANLDNNAGPETYDEQLLINGAKASGTYQAPGNPRATEDWDVLKRWAEDIAIQKRNDNGSRDEGLSQGDLTTWTIDLQVSEYRSLDDVVITDTVPDGLCPLGPKNYETVGGSGRATKNAECDLGDGDLPSKTYTSVTEQANGDFVVTWDKTTWADLAHLAPSSKRTLIFQTRTRENYQEDFRNATPVLSMDQVENKLHVQGKDWVRCTDVPNDCTDGGAKIWTEEADGELDFDESASGQSAKGPRLDKKVAATFPGVGRCDELSEADYGKTVPVYGPGDQICWKLRIDFPEYLDTKSQDVFDLLPHGLEYVNGSVQTTADNTVIVSAPDTSVAGQIRWKIGDADLIDSGKQVFEVTFASTVGSVEGHSSGDVEGNLLKFSYENTQGTAFTLRDRTDFALKLPELSLKKGVRQVEDGPVHDPAIDHVRVHEGDLVEYQIDVKNTGAAPVTDGVVWDELPTGITCGNVDPVSIALASCVGSRITWTNVQLPAGTKTSPATVALTYKLRIPNDVLPDTTFRNRAAVIKATYVSNDGQPYIVIPDNPNVKDTDLTPNAPPAEDPSDVYTPKAAVTKSATTTVTEDGNTAAQAAIGETIKYTVTTTIPAGTTIHGTPTVVDALGSRQQYVAGSLSGTLNDEDLTLTGVSVAFVDGAIKATFPSTFTAGEVDAVLVLKFNATVLDVNDNVRGELLPNSATLTYQTASGGAKTVTSPKVNTKIVEPKAQITKTHTPGGGVRSGQIVTFTLNAENVSGSNVSMAHDAVVVDRLPDGTHPVDANGDPLAHGATVPSSSGRWDATNGTITWTKAEVGALAAIKPGDSVPLTYRVRIEDPAIAGQTYVNAVDLTIRSLSLTGSRTSSSTAETAGDYRAHATDKLQAVLPTIEKTVDPAMGSAGTPVAWTIKATLPKDVRYYDATIVDLIPDGFDVDGSISVTCTSGCPASDPAIKPFPLADAGAGKLRAAWFLGDLESSSSDRVYVIGLTGKVRDTYRAAPTTKVADATRLTNTATIGTNRTDLVPATPGSVPTDFEDQDDADATVTVYRPELTIVKTPDSGDADATTVAGTDDSFTITVQNTHAHMAVRNVVVDDVLPAGLTYVAGTATATGVPSADFSETGVDGQSIGWKIAMLNPGQRVTITLPVHVASDVLDGTTLTNRATTHGDEAPEEKSDTGDLDVTAKADLRVIKTATPSPVIPGQTMTYTLKTKNLGPSDARDSTLQDTLPSYLRLVSISDEDDCRVDDDARRIDCDYGTLKPGDERTLTVVVKVDPARTTPVVNAATVTTSTTDPNPTNNRDEVTTPVTPKADVSIAKSADRVVVQGGGTVVYTLRAHNAGPSTAQSVKIADAVPAELAIVKATLVGPPEVQCTITGQQIDCPAGSLAPGADATVRVEAKALGAPPAPRGSELQHLIDVDKQNVERQLAPGETWDVEVSCPAGGIATDGSVRIQDINDQSWSQIDGVQIEQARATSLSTYRFVVRNATTKGVHLKPFVTCLERQTTGNDHAHLLDVGSLDFQTTGVLAARERQTLFFPVSGSHRAVSPGIEVLDGVARLVASEPATVGGVNGWKLTVEAVQDDTKATVSLRSLSAYVSAAGDPLHTHRMSFEHVASTVTLQPGEVKKQIRVGTGGNSCPAHHEGIVGSYDLPTGVVSLGNEPQPVNRDFDLYNTTDQVQTVKIDVECVSLRLESPMTVVKVDNTATVSSVTFDPDTTNNVSSATINVERAVLPDVPGPGSGPGTGSGSGAGSGVGGGLTGGDGGAGPSAGPTSTRSAAPAPALIRFGGVAVSSTGTTASVPVTCRAAVRCRGTVTVTAQVPVASSRGVATERAKKGKKAKKPRTRTVTIGRASYNVARGKTVKVRVKIAKKYRSLLKTGKVRNVSLRSGKVKASKRVKVQKAKKAPSKRARR